MKLLLITQNGCAPCAVVKNHLTDLNVDYTEINVSQNPEAISEYNIQSTPVVIVSDEHEHLVRVNGINIHEINHAVEVYKENIE